MTLESKDIRNRPQKVVALSAVSKEKKCETKDNDDAATRNKVKRKK